MTTQDFLNQEVSEEELRTERAQRAVRAFRAMQHGLNGYIHAITGRKDLTIQIDSGSPRTDGKKIYFCPPIELGDLTPHSRGDCDRRDLHTRQQICSACRIREEILIKILHEIAHNIFGTFAEPNPSVVAKAMERAIEELGTKYAEGVKKNWDRIPEYKKRDYMNLASLISPFLPVLVNAIEDVRVDEAMFKARRGTKVMFDAMAQAAFAEGVVDGDGKTWTWAEKPLNSQIIVGVFALGCGYDFRDWFHPDVEKALDDDKLRELVARIDTLRSAEGSYNLAFPILARLRELGFCRTEEDPEDDYEEEQDDDAEETPEDSQDEGDPGDSGSGSEGSESGDESPDSVDSDSGEAGSTEDTSEGRSEDTDGDQDGNGEPSGSDEGDSPEASSEGDDLGAEGSEDEAGDGSGNEGGESGDSGGDSSEDQDSEAGADDDSDSGEAGSEGDEGSESGGSEGPSSEGVRDSDSREEEVNSSSDSNKGADASDASDELAGSDGSSKEGTSGSSSESSDRGSEGELTDGEADNAGGADQGKASGEHEADAEGDIGSGDLEGAEPNLDSLSEVVEDDDDSVIDTGADEGEGGTETDRPAMGSAEQALEDVHVFGKHEAVQVEETPESIADTNAVQKAIIQGEYFEKPSQNVGGVREHKYGQPIMLGRHNISTGWTDIMGSSGYSTRMARRLGIDTDTSVGEDILGPALMQMRRTFADNARGSQQPHLKRGKVNNRVLGKRAWSGDDRLFQKKIQPGKRSYAVLIGIDISGSTVGVNIALAKRAAMAQAELCSRMGIDFAVYAHTANAWDIQGAEELWLDVYEIKSFNSPWDTTAKEALNKIASDCENLDGHGVEYYRKMIEKHPATDKIILYYSDGKMPAANYAEELEILQREIAYCKSHSITLLGVGIRTDSPRRHGLDTVQVDDDSSIPKVVKHLQSALLHRR